MGRMTTVSFDLRPFTATPRVPMVWLREASDPALQALIVDKLKQGNGKRRKYVRFSRSVALSSTPTYRMEQIDFSSIWFSKSELSDFAKKQRRMAKQVQQPTSNMEEELCLRGLEDCASIRAALEARARKVAVIQAVLDEQRKQKERGMNDPVRIRKKSASASMKSRIQARDLAKQDAKDAYRYRNKLSRLATSRLRVDTIRRRIVLERYEGDMPKTSE